MFVCGFVVLLSHLFVNCVLETTNNSEVKPHITSGQHLKEIKTLMTFDSNRTHWNLIGSKRLYPSNDLL